MGLGRRAPANLQIFQCDKLKILCQISYEKDQKWSKYSFIYQITQKWRIKSPHPLKQNFFQKPTQVFIFNHNRKYKLINI